MCWKKAARSVPIGQLKQKRASAGRIGWVGRNKQDTASPTPSCQVSHHRTDKPERCATSRTGRCFFSKKPGLCLACSPSVCLALYLLNLYIIETKKLHIDRPDMQKIQIILILFCLILPLGVCQTAAQETPETPKAPEVPQSQPPPLHPAEPGLPPPPLPQPSEPPLVP